MKEKEGYPDSESKGIPFEDGLSERVMRITVDNISPPLLPQVHVCKDAGTMAFVLIRVDEKRETPYTVRHNRPYVRTGNVNTPEDLATLERLKWLQQGHSTSSGGFLHF